ncbi:MAG: hypothetical protein ACOH19_11595 [Rhodoglobus sp.]
MSSPFDDPELRAQMARMGAIHVPGTADKLMEELAPLLAADGIDLNALGANPDFDAINAAMARATARRNFELFTPVGSERAGSLRELRRFSEAMADGNRDEAQRVLAAIDPEPSATMRAISHVIGAGIGMLDTWHVSPENSSALGGVRPPQWDVKRSRSAATDILVLASKGRAFDAIDTLIKKYGGLHVFEGTALAVAATLASWAKHDGVSVRELANRIFPASTVEGSEPTVRGKSSGVAFRRPANQSPGLRATAPLSIPRQFSEWVRNNQDGAMIDADEAELELTLVIATALGARLDVNDPADIPSLIDLVLDAADVDEGDLALDTIHDYLHFRMQTSPVPHVWDSSHEYIEEVLSDGIMMIDEIDHALEAAAEIAPVVRHAALARTQLVGAVSSVLSWIGSGQPVTSAGMVRRADIQGLAAMLGISAIGVASASLSPIDDQPFQARSMADVPALAAWWEALLSTDLIQLTATRVRQGPAAGEWLAAPEPPPALAEMLAGVFVAETLSQAELRMPERYGRVIITGAIHELLKALAPELHDDSLQSESGVGELPVLRATWILHPLEQGGLVTRDAEGRLEIAGALRGIVAQGVVLAMAYRSGALDDAPG